MRRVCVLLVLVLPFALASLARAEVSVPCGGGTIEVSYCDWWGADLLFLAADDKPKTVELWPNSVTIDDLGADPDCRGQQPQEALSSEISDLKGGDDDTLNRRRAVSVYLPLWHWRTVPKVVALRQGEAFPCPGRSYHLNVTCAGESRQTVDFTITVPSNGDTIGEDPRGTPCSHQP